MISPHEFKAEVIEWAQEIGVQPKEIHLRQMTRKWGSSSSKGRLTFNSELLAQPEGIRQDVIIHELLHMRYPNHGKMFKAMVRSYLNNSFKLDSEERKVR